MDHLYHGHVSHNQRVNPHFPMDFLWISYGFPMDFSYYITSRWHIARQGAEIAPHAEPWRAVRPREGRLEKGRRVEKKWEIHQK